MTDLPASQSVESLLNQHLPHADTAAWYCAPEIPPKKLRNAIAKYAHNLTAESVLALGDGTVFGSAKEGILITAETLFSCTTGGTFSVPLQDISIAKKLGGWPNYGVELVCHDGTTHKILTICFDKQQVALVNFLNSVATCNSAPVVQQAPSPVHKESPHTIPAELQTLSHADGPTIQEINAGMKLVDVCQHNGIEDVATFFETALRSDSELPLLKGYCQYVGFNARQVDAVTLLTNRRLLLFSLESGTKIALVELSKRLLGKLPVPFFDSLVGFFLFTIPGSIYTAIRGGKQNIISQALEQDENKLLSQTPPLRKVQDFDFDDLSQAVSQIKLSNNVCSGLLDRKFGITFEPIKVAKTFCIPKDLILPDYQTSAPFERLLNAIRPTLTRQGLTYHFDPNAQTLTITPTAITNQKLAA